MLTVLFAALTLQAAAPADEAERLGRRLAAAGGLATMVPMLIEKDLVELAGEEPGLTATQRARLIEIGRAEGRRNLDRLVAQLGLAYAKRLSVADLRVLVAQAEHPAAARHRAAEPAAIAETVAALGSIDLKALTAAAFCKETARLCKRR